MAKINLTEDDVARGKSVDEAGWHPGKVIKYEDATAKTDGSALYKYTAEITGGKYNKMKVFFQFSEKAMGFMVPFVRALGVPVGAKGISGFDTSAPVGKNLEFYLKPDQYEGRAQTKVADFRPVGGSVSQR